MFLLSSAQPAGLNCDLSSKAVVSSEGRSLEVTIPIHKFSSGEPDRDRDVVRILKADAQPAILVRTVPIAKNPFETDHGELAAEMEIGGAKFPMVLPYRIETRNGQALLIGALKTTFQAFSIEPPSVGGGLVAKVRDDLTLHYQLRKDGFR